MRRITIISTNMDTLEIDIEFVLGGQQILRYDFVTQAAQVMGIRVAGPSLVGVDPEPHIQMLKSAGLPEPQPLQVGAIRIWLEKTQEAWPEGMWPGYIITNEKILTLQPIWHSK